MQQDAFDLLNRSDTYISMAFYKRKKNNIYMYVFIYIYAMIFYHVLKFLCNWSSPSADESPNISSKPQNHLF